MTLRRIIFCCAKGINIKKDFRWLTFRFINFIESSSEWFLLSAFKFCLKTYENSGKLDSGEREREMERGKALTKQHWQNYFVWFMLHLFTHFQQTLVMPSQSKTETCNNNSPRIKSKTEVRAHERDFPKKPHWIFHLPENLRRFAEELKTRNSNKILWNFFKAPSFNFRQSSQKILRFRQEREMNFRNSFK